MIALARDGVYDVTKRYTRKWHEVPLSSVSDLGTLLFTYIEDVSLNIQFEIFLL